MEPGAVGHDRGSLSSCLLLMGWIAGRGSPHLGALIHHFIQLSERLCFHIQLMPEVFELRIAVQYFREAFQRLRVETSRYPRCPLHECWATAGWNPGSRGSYGRPFRSVHSGVRSRRQYGLSTGSIRFSTRRSFDQRQSSSSNDPTCLTYRACKPHSEAIIRKKKEEDEDPFPKLFASHIPGFVPAGLNVIFVSDTGH